MSVFYDLDPGRLEVYRPRADGLLGRSFCGAALIHLVVACLLLTVRFPQPKAAPPRHYRLTEVTLLPPRPAPAPAEKQEKVTEKLGPRDLSLFLNDLAPAPARRHRRGRRHSHRRSASTPVATADTIAREVEPEAPEAGDLRRSNIGPKLAEGLPNLLERPMSESRPVAPILPPVIAGPESSAPVPVAAPSAARPALRKPSPAAPWPRSVRPASGRFRPAAARPRQRGGGDRREPAPVPQPFMVARAERSRPLSDLLPSPRDPGNAAGPTAGGPSPVLLRPSLPADRPVDLPAGHAESGKKLAQLPGDLFGSGSGLGPGASHKEIALPEGRPGAAAVRGPRRPRASRGKLGHTSSLGGGEATGVNPIPAVGGVRLPDEERPGIVRAGAPSDLGELGGKGTPVASLLSTGTEGRGSGSGAAPGGSGAGGGYGADGPRAIGGLNRSGRPGPHAHSKTTSAGDGAGGGPGANGGIGIPGAGAGGDTGLPSQGGGSSGDGVGRSPASGKRVARAELPLNGTGDGGRGTGHGSGGGSEAGPAVDSGPRSFENNGKRGGTSVPSGGSGKRHRQGKSDGGDAGDPGGVSLPSGGGANDDPSRDAGDGASDAGFQKGRTHPTGVYVSTTGSYTLPGAIYQGDFRYNSEALRIIMDELNSRTKVKVRLGGKYESIAEGSFKHAPVVVFTGHQAFELTGEQRQVLKDYVNQGGMIWADFSHAAPFEDSFRNEMETIFGSRPEPLPLSHPIYRSFYVLHRVPAGDLGDSAPFEGITVGSRLGVVITPNRYFSAVSRSLNTSEAVQEGALQAVVNIYMYAAGNYRAVKDAGD